MYLYLKKYKIFLRLIIIFFGIFFLFSKSAWAGDCDTSISLATTSQLVCANDDTLNVSSGGSIIFDGDRAVDGVSTSGVTIINEGTIQSGQTDSTADYTIRAQSSTNMTIINSGTIEATEDYGLYILNAENLTITNKSGGTIRSAETSNSRATAIGGNGTTGFTLHNYGTLDAQKRTIISTSGGDNATINNYNGGVIDSNNGATIRWSNASNVTLNNYSGATIKSPNANKAIDFGSSTNITVDNAGTISADNNNWAFYCVSCSGLSLTNSGTINAGGTVAVDIQSVTGTNTITNSGTISAGGNKAIKMSLSSGVTITNSGTISTEASYAIDGENSTNATITNSGTIRADTFTIDFGNGAGSDDGSGATINNSGTIEATAANGDAILIGDGGGTFNDVTITNSGTISALNDSIVIVASTTGTNIVVDGNNVTFTGEIDMNSTATTMTLSCTLTKDLDIEIHNKTNMTVTDNLCGNDTYEILDSNKVADSDNSETDGYLRILGEDLDIAQDNAQYRSENVLSKLRAIISQASNDRDLHAFHSTHRRSEYTDNTSGAVGYFNSNSISPAASDYFIGYADQRVSFANSEYRGGENIALGMNKKFTANQFSYYIAPLIGFEDLNITDVETEGNQAVNTNLTSQFMGLDAGIGKTITANEKNRTSFKMHATYGVQRFPGYTASFADGELLVDDAVDQVLGANFEIRNALGIDRNLQLYLGGNWSETLSDELEITADGESKNVSPEMQKALGHYAGIDVATVIKGFNLDLNLEYGTTGGLTHQVASLALTKFF